MYRVKAVCRWLIFRVLPMQFGAYSNPANVGGYLRWWSFRDRVIAFQRADGRPQFYW